MPVLAAIRERFESEKPLDGLAHRGVPARHHRDRQPDAHAEGRRRGRSCCARRNPLSTQDDVAAALVATTASRTYAIKGEDNDTYYQHIDAAIDHKPQITMDDGADVVGASCTPSGPSTLRRRDRRHRGDDHRRHPPARDGSATARSSSRSSPSTTRTRSTCSTTATAPGSRRSTAIIRATNVLIAGSTFVVAGYGWCGRGVATRAKRHGRATSSSPRSIRSRRSRRSMDGYRSCRWRTRPRSATSSSPSTGDKSRHRARALRAMKDGAIVANSGHFNVEIDIPAAARRWRRQTREVRAVRRGVHAGRRPPDLPARRRPARQPVRAPRATRPRSWTCRSPTRRCRPSTSRSNNAVAREEGLRRARRDRRERSRASSSRPWASRSTRSPPSRRSTWRRGTRAPDPPPAQAAPVKGHR